jgi:two-component system, chemotaxis family, sensor kinase CheA
LSSSQDDVFREMFFEEAHELLDRLETGLTGLGAAGEDRARLDRVYRDAHSLKGAAAMVGYAVLADVARKLEQSLAQVRTGKELWTAELARSLVTERDQLAEMIEVEERQLRERSQ